MQDLLRPRHWPSNWISGASAATGVALCHMLAAAAFGPQVALAVTGGAVCASVPDVPNTARRTLQRVLPAALMASLVTFGVGMLHQSVAGMALLIALITFVSQLALAWGPRAGPLSFSAMLALVFAMADVPRHGVVAVLGHAGWALLGGLTYVGWAWLSSRVLRRRYRELAVARALRASAARMRSRAARMGGTLPPGDEGIRVSIRDDAALAEALQSARDFVFEARPSVHSRRLADIVLRLIDLRDLLLGSRLDLRLLGGDNAAQAWRRELATELDTLAQVLDALAAAIDRAGALPQVDAKATRAALAARLQAATLAAKVAVDDPRRRLMTMLGDRLGHVIDDVAALCERAAGPDRPLTVEPATLRLFVSPEGWPLAALKAQWTLESDVMRHALRATLALVAAWLLAQALPWATHPHWLVLSVAVVLRGNLEQTLARRNDRVVGTVIGCVLAAGLAALDRPALLPWVFIVAVGTAHAWVNVRYLVAATAATLMALVQPMLVLPGSDPAVVERLADTVIGAALAWAACFVLPSWERRTVERHLRVLQRALAAHARRLLLWQPDAKQALDQRQSRQQAYAALGALAAQAQRNAAETHWTRLPEPLFEAVLRHGYRLMALLGTVQRTLQRERDRLDEARIAPALDATADAFERALAAPPSDTPAEEGQTDHPGADWPEQDARADLTPWVLRRLRLGRQEAGRLAVAAQALNAEAKAPRH